MMDTKIIFPAIFTEAKIELPTSKSISNRLLLIHELGKFGFEGMNWSQADDTQILKNLLENKYDIEDCEAGGTTFRFLLALRCLQGKETILTGSARLKERLIKPLVEALNSLGAKIEYLEKEGFPPLKLNPCSLTGNEIEISSSISSQFISALLLIAPYLPTGLIISWKDQPVSFSYVEMTIQLMKQYGVDVIQSENRLMVPSGKYQVTDFSVPADWSAAVFFFVMAAIKTNQPIHLKNIKSNTFQGDEKLLEWMINWGVESKVVGDGLVIIGKRIPTLDFEYDFTNTPDLAQAFAVMAAVSNRRLLLTGLSTLIGKETNRLLALKTELEKAGAEIAITQHSLEVQRGIRKELLEKNIFNTYNDHRMVMALSLLGLAGTPVVLDDISPVTKSFPNYFDELGKMGVEIT
ncbi:MAG: 3-phosphoshikimate 1-carboxyvinyltransferase [Bacteroidetes bacterium]|nr:3-phosphoshikimate 1-carboxyvinyltransferase [Bacteroidota bacterium]